MAAPLPSKEQSLFRHVVQGYESKQYKKGIKAADQILRKFPNHGDTQAMKALIFNSQGKTDDAFELAKLALKNAMKSHVCWHVYGLLYRSAKKYDESIKAYRFALRLDPTSVQIQRDLAMLQMQMRDYAGYTQSRRAMLQAKPSIRQNWTALAVAHHVEGDLDAAENILNTYEDTLKTTPSRADREHAGAVMYKNSIIAETGDTARALEHLLTIYKTHPDRAELLERKARYLLTLGKMSDAETAYRLLLKRNADNSVYYQGLERALGLDRQNSVHAITLANLYRSFADARPRSNTPRRIPLDFLHGDAFREAADTYLRKMLAKGVPSTFMTVKALYIDPEKMRTLQDLVEQYSIEDGSQDASDVNKSNGDTQTKEDSSTTWKLAVHCFLARHYDYQKTRDLDKAMEHIDKAIELSKNPKEYEYVMIKARIWKHRGDTAKAAETMDQARQMDLKDRSIATKSAKYQLRNNEPEKAIKTMGLFTRDKAVGGPLGDLIDMQCVWYLHEDAMAHLRLGKTHIALKRLHTCFAVFDAYQEDQFDFHTFSLRKGQIDVYINMVRWEDRLRDHPWFATTVVSAIKIYLDLYDRSRLLNGDSANGNTEGAAERKKAARKARKEAEAARDEQKAAIAAKPVLGPDGEAIKPDDDPHGFKLSQTQDPLGDAMKFLQPLLDLSPRNIDTQLMGFEVMIRRKKYLAALKCLISAKSIDEKNATLQKHIGTFKQAINSIAEPLPAQIDSVIKSAMAEL